MWFYMGGRKVIRLLQEQDKPYCVGCIGYKEDVNDCLINDELELFDLDCFDDDSNCHYVFVYEDDVDKESV